MDDNQVKGQAARVGFVIFIATLIVIGGLYMVGEGFFVKYATYKMMFPSTVGLNEGAKVYLSGVGAGRVEEVEFAQEGHQPKILVTVSIYKKYTNKIREDSFAWIQSEGLLGDKAICILAGEDTKPAIEEGSLIHTVDRSIIEDLVGKGLINNANDLLENISVLVKDLNEGKSLVGKLLKDPDTGDRFVRLITQLELSSNRLNSILEKIDKGEGSVGVLVNDPSTALSLQDLFLGVSESNMLKNLVRRAEQGGRKLRIQDEQKIRERLRQETDRVLEQMEKRDDR